MTSQTDFDKSEYDDRYRRIRHDMDRNGLDCVIATSQSNYVYLSGHTSTYWIPHWMWEGSMAYPFIFILPRDREPIIITHAAEEAPARNSTYVNDIRTYSEYPFSISVATKAISELGLSKAKIGCEFGAESRLGLPYEEFEKLKSSLSQMQFLDASKIVWNARLIKSAEEIRRIKKANEITIRALERTYGSARVGITEREMASMVQRYMIEEGADRCQYYFAYEARHGFSMFQNRPGDRAFKRGECVYLDFSASYMGYSADVNRMFVVGSASEDVRNEYDAVCYAEQLMIDSMKAGTKVSDVCGICYKALEERGLSFPRTGRAGHGTGILPIEPPSISLNDATELSPGMVITAEPRIITKDGCFTIEDAVVIDRDGYERITSGLSWLQIIG